MAAKILESNNYKMFELWEVNRDVNKIKVLTQSMKTHGWINSKPISVTQGGNGKVKIRDGHHRFDVAERLGIPIKYVVDVDTATPYELDASTNKWSTMDCLTSYCRAGKIEYLKVKEYCDETGISMTLAASMLMGDTAGSGNYHDPFRKGTYKTKPTIDHAETVKEIVLCMKKYGVKFFNNTYLVISISKCAWVDKFSCDKMKLKIKNFSHIIEKKANIDQYMSMLEELYNRQSQQKIPLKYMAIEKAKQRKIAAQF